jgi:hypothetical protein
MPGKHFSVSKVLGVSSAPFTASDVPAALKIMVNVSSKNGAREAFNTQPVLRLESANGKLCTSVFFVLFGFFWEQGAHHCRNAA